MKWIRPTSGGWLLGLLVVSASSTAAQDVLKEWSIRRGSSLSAESLPDLDGDGFRELLWGDPVFGEGNQNHHQGRVVAFSSRTGEVLYERRGTARAVFFGGPMELVGDLSGDGFPDIIAGSGGDGTYFLNGRDGSVLHHVPWSAGQILPLSDVDRDGIDEYFLTLGVFLGRTFEFKYQIYVEPVIGFGFEGTEMDDVDGDGLADFAIGAPGDYWFNLYDPGVVFVYSGATGALLYRSESPDPKDPGLPNFYGESLCSPGDLNGDGIGDLVVGASLAGPAPTYRGALFLLDGPTGALIARIDAGEGVTKLGGLDVMGPAGDVNGNGMGDFLVFARQVNDPLVLLVDGTGEILYSVPASGSPILGGHDWNGDGFPDFLLRTRPNTGVTLYSGAPPGISVLGLPCTAPASPRIGATGSPRIGERFEIHLTDVPADVPAMLVGDPSPPLDVKCPLLRAPQRLRSMRTKELRPGEGVATVAIDLPPDPALIGSVLYLQWLAAVPAGGRSFSTTRVLRVEIQAEGASRASLPDPSSLLLVR